MTPTKFSVAAATASPGDALRRSAESWGSYGSSPCVSVRRVSDSDLMQAVYYRGVLAHEQNVSARELADAHELLARRLARGDLFAIEPIRRQIRAIEKSQRDLERLICALDRRFGVGLRGDAATG